MKMQLHIIIYNFKCLCGRHWRGRRRRRRSSISHQRSHAICFSDLFTCNTLFISVSWSDVFCHLCSSSIVTIKWEIKPQNSRAKELLTTSIKELRASGENCQHKVHSFASGKCLSLALCSADGWWWWIIIRRGMNYDYPPTQCSILSL